MPTLRNFFRQLWLMSDTKKIVIKGGRVVDPANGFDEVADVLIVGDKIEAVGSVKDADAEVIDAAMAGA